MSDATRRTIRTGFQVVLGFLAVVAVMIPFGTDFGLSAEQVASVGGLLVAATATITAVQNKLEELGALKPLAYGSEPKEVPLDPEDYDDLS